MKMSLAMIATITMMQGCAAVGPAVGLVALAGVKQSGADTTDWASRVEQMNCSEMRTELANLEKRSGFLRNAMPGNTTGIRISALKTQMRRHRCRIPA